MSDMETVIKSGNLDLIPEAIRSYARTSMIISAVMNPRRSKWRVCMDCIDVAVESDDEILRLVINTCVSIYPSGILAYYLSTRKEISWRTARMLLEVSHLGTEKELVRLIDSSESVGMKRLLYLEKGDV